MKPSVILPLEVLPHTFGLLSALFLEDVYHLIAVL